MTGGGAAATHQPVPERLSAQGDCTAEQAQAAGVLSSDVELLPRSAATLPSVAEAA